MIGLRKARVRQVFMDSLYEPLVEGLLTFFPWTSPDHMQKYYVPTQIEIELEKTIGKNVRVCLIFTSLCVAKEGGFSLSK